MKNYIFFIFLIFIILPFVFIPYFLPPSNLENFSSKELDEYAKIKDYVDKIDINKIDIKKDLSKIDFNKLKLEKINLEKIDNSLFPSHNNIITLKKVGNKYSFPFHNETITINPSEGNNVMFTYSNSPLNHLTCEYKFSEISDLKYNLSVPNNNYSIDLTFDNKPVTITTNNYELIIKTEKTTDKSGKKYNIVLYDKLSGEITIIPDKKTKETSHIIIETSKDDLKTLPVLASIFTGFLIFEKVNNLENIDYSKIFSTPSK